MLISSSIAPRNYSSCDSPWFIQPRPNGQTGHKFVDFGGRPFHQRSQTVTRLLLVTDVNRILFFRYTQLLYKTPVGLTTGVGDSF